MSFVQISLDEIIFNKDKVKIIQQKYNDKQILIQKWNNIDWNELIKNIELKCNQKKCDYSDIKKITTALINTVTNHFKDNIYYNTIIDSLKSLNLDLVTSKENLMNIISKWKYYFLNKMQGEEEELNLIKECFQKNNNNSQTVDEQIENFINYLKTCSIKNIKELQKEIISTLSDTNKFCNSTLSCKQYLLLFISKSNQILSFCILSEFYFKQLYHLSHFCGDYIQFIKHFITSNLIKKNKNYNLSFELRFNENTFNNFVIPLYIENYSFYIDEIFSTYKEITSNNEVNIIYKMKKNEIKNSGKQNTLLGLMNLNLNLYNCVNTNIVKTEILTKYINKCNEFSDEIKPLLNLINKQVCLNINQTNVELISYMILDKLKNNKTITLSFFIYQLLFTPNVIFKYYLYSITDKKVIKIIPNFEIENNEVIHTILLEELATNPSEESKECFKLVKFDILNIPKYNKTLLDYAIISKQYSSNYNYVKNICGDESINLMPIQNLNSDDIKIEEVNKINNCNLTILFPSQLLNLLPNIYPSQFFHLKKMNEQNNGEIQMKAFIHQEYIVDKSEILYLKSNTLIPNISLLLKCIEYALVDEVKLILIVSENSFFIIEILQSFIDFIKTNENQSTIFMNDLESIFKTNLKFEMNEYQINFDLLCNLFTESINKLMYKNKLIMKCTYYLRNEIINTDFIEYNYNQKSNTCFPSTYSDEDKLINETEENIRNTYYSQNYFDEIGPFYQIDERDLHHKNEYVDVYDEDDREDEVEQYSYTDYDNALLLSEFNQYNFSPEEFNVELKVDLNEKEYYEQVQSNEDYIQFSEALEKVDNEYISINEIENKSNSDDKKIKIKENSKIKIKENKSVIMFKNDDTKNMEEDVEDYMIKPNFVKVNVDKEQFSKDVRTSNNDYLNFNNNNTTISLSQIGEADMENPLERKYEEQY
jgi:hypothetical protein